MAGIHRSRKSGYTFRSGVMRRETLWLFVDHTITTFNQGVATLLNSLNAAALAIRPFTIVRTRGLLYITSDQQVATETQLCNYGIAVVFDQAVAIGVTAVPTPVTDSGSDLWFVFEPMMNAFTFGDATGFSNEGTKYDIDSRAMRKVEDGQDAVVVIEAPAVGNGGCVVQAFARILIKLH